MGRCDLRACKEHIHYLNSKRGAPNREWSEFMPFAKRYFEVERDNPLGNGFGYAWGFSIDMKYVEAFNIPVAPPVIHTRPRLCVHSAFKSSGDEAFAARQLDFIWNFASENGLAVSGRAFGNPVFCGAPDRGKGAATGYFEVWLPVEK
jgi:hypothetical protein